MRTCASKRRSTASNSARPSAADKQNMAKGSRTSVTNQTPPTQWTLASICRARARMRSSVKSRFLTVYMAFRIAGGWT